MSKNAFFLFLALLFFGCTDGYEVVIPDHILSKEKMAEVMLDIHLIEATLNLNAGNVNKDAVEGKLSFDVFKKHNISREKYEESYTFYTENPDAMKEVYDIVLKELSKLQASVANSK
jgi:hypothetical protein